MYLWWKWQIFFHHGVSSFWAKHCQLSGLSQIGMLHPHLLDFRGWKISVHETPIFVLKKEKNDYLFVKLNAQLKNLALHLIKYYCIQILHYIIQVDVKSTDKTKKYSYLKVIPLHDFSNVAQYYSEIFTQSKTMHTIIETQLQYFFHEHAHINEDTRKSSWKRPKQTKAVIDNHRKETLIAQW